MPVTSDVTHQILRQAIEGGGLVGWATVEEWDGVANARITERGGSVHVLDGAVARRGVASILADDDYGDAEDLEILSSQDADCIDGALADAVVQVGLFGQVVYR
ncbi:MAG: hypothetical protein L0H59_09745 [Tomitella sp.]|nr:hypothetical protein [Tomitella sp.]